MNPATRPSGRPGRTHNLGTVIAFEVRRTLRRRSFWVLTLAVPAMLLAVTSLVMLSSTAAASNAEASRRQPIAFTYTDASGLVDPAVAKAAGGTPTSDAASAKAAVIAGRADLFVAYPADPGKSPIEVVARDKGITNNGDYGAIAQDVLKGSVSAHLADKRVGSVLADQTSVHQLNYVDGRVAPGIAAVVLPGVFLVVFYLAIVMLGNQMLNITVEEKENRVTEMILTTIHPTTLIVGKLLALVVVGLVQALVLIGPMMLFPGIVASMIPTSELPAGASGSSFIPSMADLAAAVNPPAIALGAVLFLGSFLLFTGLLVSVGAIMPTAKDAGSAFGAIVVALFVPFYAMGLIMTDPHGVASEVLTFFPLTAPVTAMVRNAAGTLLPWEAAVTVVIVYAAAAALLALGITLFRTGSISYDTRLNIRKVLGRRPQTA